MVVANIELETEISEHIEDTMLDSISSGVTLTTTENQRKLMAVRRRLLRRRSTT